ncbi:MAG: PIN domain protein [Candidatus Marinimicrobia bacterium]|nr:PIN domain protein [Candidatus Neomarinimicrobiota bacterium]
MKLKIYADTSVLGGCFDDEFMEPSKQLIDDFKIGEKILVISDLTLREIENAPQKVKDVLESIPIEFINYAILDDEAKHLAQRYIKERAISLRSLVDAQHIAIATINRVDVLVSWNFKDIVNLRRIQLFNATNLKYGHPLIEIRSPIEVI